jgi:two-component system sensor histidine kinase QseC
MASIRRHLLVTLISLFILAWFITFASTGLATRRSIDALFDAQLAHDAGVLLALAPTGFSFNGSHVKLSSTRDVPLAVRKYRKTLAFQIWEGDQLVLRSEGAPNLGVPAQDGYQNLVLKEHNWRTFTTHSADRQFTVWVGERFYLRDNLTNEITWDMLFPLVLGVPLLAVAIGWGVGRGLVPLRRVANAVARRSPSNLQPVDMHKVPAELNVVVETLNGLLKSLSEAFERERRFTADAAHEIRTPLAGIKTHAQVALRQGNEGQRRQAMEEVIQGVDRTTRLVDQLLTLARLDHQALEKDFHEVDLGSLAADVIAALDPEAASKRISVSLVNTVHAGLKGSSVALSMMIRNLVDNAIRYTPEGGAVQVETSTEDGHAQVSVTDNGPGVPEEERARVFDRFYRGNRVAPYGCGLGLSIVRRVADLHGASISLGASPAGHGLQVRIIFPSAGDADPETATSSE